MSSSGYTPVFASIYDGTLYGQWPAAAVFASLLPLCDVNGTVDMSLQAISGRTGWPLDLLRQGIEQLCTPDPDSRSGAEQGRRLTLIHADRPWGWKVVNHATYREKARLKAKDAARTASGADAERKRTARTVPCGTSIPPVSPAVPLSDSDSDSNKKREDARETVSAAIDGWEFIDKRMRPVYPRGTYRHGHWIAASKIVERLVGEEGVDPGEIVVGCQRYLAQQVAHGNEGGKFVCNPERFLTERRWTEEFPLGDATNDSGDDPAAVQAWERLLATDGAERTTRVQAALQAIGGWPRVRERTSKDTPFLRRDFIAAFANLEVAA